MEPKKVTFADLWKMESGEIPMTEEGQKSITALREFVAKSPFKFGAISIPKINIEALSSHLRSNASSMGLIKYNLSDWADKLQGTQEAIRGIVGTHSAAFSAFRPSFQQLHLLAERIKNDPEIQLRWKLLNERLDLIDSIIPKWKAHLVHRMEYRPFEDFARHFEHACYDLLDDAQSNAELAAISRDDFICILKAVADEIVATDEEKHRARLMKLRAKKNLPVPVTLVLPPASIESEEPLGHARISLIHYYQGKPISRTNSKDIALYYGHDKPNAWKVLLKTYGEIEGGIETRRKRKNIIEDIEAILKRLSGDSLQLAEKELNTIKTKRR